MLWLHRTSVYVVPLYLKATIQCETCTPGGRNTRWQISAAIKPLPIVQKTGPLSYTSALYPQEGQYAASPTPLVCMSGRSTNQSINQ